MINKPLLTRFSKTLLVLDGRPTRRWVLAVDVYPTFLNTETINETLQ